ncbi:MAG TPA: acyl-CoA dehydrogenase family protein [Thermoanaerobaculia bacterium]|jgi:alkylation response protein AidB-like acyl-CoA dehydrogenase|nr:acyl-CoA dehydrogenase family protein [Thermoanaerobaculia bacterium]
MALKATRTRGLETQRRETAGKRKRSAPAQSIRGKLAADELREQIARSAAALEAALAARDLSSFYRVFRSTDLPFLAPIHAADARGLTGACFDVLHRLGSLSPAVALAIENHYYVSSALATFPVRGDRAFAARREALVRSIVTGRFFVANTNSRVHTDKVGSFGSRARREADGIRVSGSAAYMSLASHGDVVFYMTQIEDEGPAVLVSPLRDNPGIEVGPLLFPNAMVDSDTRRVIFHDYLVPNENVLMVGNNEAMSKLVTFQLTWHQGLLAAPFLGAAARALEEARGFLRAVRGPDGRPLAELDGMAVDVGRMAIRYRAACALTHEAGEALERLAGGDPSLAEFGEAFDLACAAKQFGTKCAEEIVGEVRRIIGARAFAGSHPLERLSQEVMFGPLGGEVNAFIERRYGRRALGDTEFLSNRW